MRRFRGLDFALVLDESWIARQLSIGRRLVSAKAMNKVCRRISIVLAAYILSHVPQQAYAQDVCNMGHQVVELLSTIDPCAATGHHLAELEFIRRQVVASHAATDCEGLQERISELELTIRRRPAERPTTLDQPVPMCEATQRTRARSSGALVESIHG